MTAYKATVIKCDAHGCTETVSKRWTQDPSGRMDNSPSDVRRRARKDFDWTRLGEEDFCWAHRPEEDQ